MSGNVVRAFPGLIKPKREDKDGGGEITIRAMTLFLRRNRHPPPPMTRRERRASANSRHQAADAAHRSWKETSALVLMRGPFVIASGIDIQDAKPMTLQGHFLNLFDPHLRLSNALRYAPGRGGCFLTWTVSRQRNRRLLPPAGRSSLSRLRRAASASRSAASRPGMAMI